MTGIPSSKLLAEYLPPAWLVDEIDLRFELDAQATKVVARLELRRNPAAAPGQDLVLDGVGLQLGGLWLDGHLLAAGEYAYDGKCLLLPRVPDRCRLESEVLIHPATNTALEGLYLSGDTLCTQCEAEGFRRITFFPDRPDVLARFTTTLVAEKTYPVLLAGGNPAGSGVQTDGRHWACWRDPHPKPCYLFALVAGDLALLEDSFRTASGSEVALRIYVEPRNRDRCGHAMTSLKHAMRWDEEVYGREYDLEVFMIVAVDDFNMGAMENKGLNVFNAKYILARPETATDTDYAGIEGVVAHEYFHNWTGNRVTCRDWFQLSLKEGLTVFRDQEFSADMASRAVKRIEDVRIICDAQFREDSGPMAHPIRPDSYMEINNFYSVTVYNKGAEVIRMLHTLLGAADFRRGMDLYFARHDGQAVTCDDFVQAMADASGRDLTQFMRWYSQAGTPRLEACGSYDPPQRRYRLTLRQSCPPTPGQPHKDPLHIPVALGLLDRDGQAMSVALAGAGREKSSDFLLELTQAEQTFTFESVPSAPVLSLLRGFTAPVRSLVQRSDEELALLFTRDRDPYSRWEAGQQLGLRILLRRMQALREPNPAPCEPLLHQVWGAVLSDRATDPALLAFLLSLPSESWIAQQLEDADPVAIFQARQSCRQNLGQELRREFFACHEELRARGPYRFDGPEAGRRSLRNLALAYLAAPLEASAPDQPVLELIEHQYRLADNMTDRLAALLCLAHTELPERETALADFYQTWQDDSLLVDKWLMLQATAPDPGVLARVRTLLLHPAFSLRKPNRVRALIGAFCQGNPARFHAEDGSGYLFLEEQLRQLDPLNPQIAARMAAPLSVWRRYTPERRERMRGVLERLATSSLSPHLAEVVHKSLV
ncbi:MAG: aminopeptidase N [Desulfobulbaceae bacterium A2]|nr:MAG: aminopeptidase N [Desulfobulbaceae bacterium A2]